MTEPITSSRPGYKLCGARSRSGCNLLLPLDAFGKKTANADGREARCRECVNRSRRERYHRNPTPILERNRAWREANPDKAEAGRADYIERNADRIRERRRAYDAANREVIRERNR
jgi:hypothetical protein